MIAWLVAAIMAGTVQSASSQEMETRLAIGPGVACRAQPDRNAPVVAAHRLGEPLTVRGMTQDRSGAAWFEVVGRPSCWVSGPMTVAFAYDSPDTALAAIAEHALALGANAGFEHLVAVDNLLLERKRRRTWYSRAPAAVPPLLELRHLQIVDRAARRIDGRRAAERDPLRNAWLLAHADVVTHFEPGDLYHVAGSHFWALYERHETSPLAEEMAWTAAETPVFTDECMIECHLSVLAGSYMPYWTRFPRGPHVLDAVAKGARAVGGAARYCPLVAGEYLQERPDQIRTLIDSLRESLQNVTVAPKDDLLRHISEIEATCLGSPLDLKSSRAIPELVKTLGLGFSFVPRQLAEFGEEAVPAVLAVVTSPDSDREDVGAGLMALRFLVEGALSRPLSAGARGGITRAAEQWLGARQQSILTLGAAIDLAAVLGDPNLRRTLEALASSPTAVAARGISAGSIERIRKRAADRLAGVPPLPRP